MTLGAPFFLLAGTAVAIGVAVLHWLAHREPRPRPFPTARFVPERAARAPAFARRPSDPLLLACRVLAVLLLGLAFARPTIESRRPLGRIVLAVGAAVHDSLRGGADTVIEAPGLSGGLVSALRAARGIGTRVDSLELVIVSPLRAADGDAATVPIRALWAGRARLVRAATPAAPPNGVDAALAPDDPLGAAITLAGLGREPVGVRVRREVPTSADSAWARETGGALVYWPAGRDAAGWLTSDTAGALTAGPATVVHPFPRAVPPAGVPVAWWVDGSVAASQRPLGAGCARAVAVDLSAGDIALRETTHRVLRELLAPCAGRSNDTPLADSVLAALHRPGPLLDARTVPAPDSSRVPATVWPLLAAAVVLLAEHGLRGRGVRR